MTGLEARPASVALLTDAVGRLGDDEALVAALEASVADAASEAREPLLVAALRAVLPTTVRWLRDHGAPDPVGEDSVADVERKLDRYGFTGTGLDWLSAVATGRVVAVGRLQFERGAHLPDGSRAWGVHVPETGPLDPAACDASFARAPGVLRALDPGVDVTTWTCRSWTLDPGLVDVLGSTSNLGRFAARFDLEPSGPDDEHEGDESVAKFVFGTSLDAARSAEPTGRLQRAVLDRWAAGEHWLERTGVAAV